MIDHDNYFTLREVAALAKRSKGTIKLRAKQRGMEPTLILGVKVWTTAQAKELAREVKLGRPYKVREAAQP